MGGEWNFFIKKILQGKKTKKEKMKIKEEKRTQNLRKKLFLRFTTRNIVFTIAEDKKMAERFPNESCDKT